MTAQPTRDKNIDKLPAKKLAWIRLNQRYAAEFRKAGYDKQADTLQACETTEDLVACSSCGHYFYAVHRCKQRVCVLCSYKVATERAHYLLEVTKHMKHPKLLTLTLPRCHSDPRGQIRFLRKSFSRLRRFKLFSTVRGGSYLIECIPKPDGWHIHLHCLLDSPYLPYRSIFSAWREITGNHVPQVDIRSATDPASRTYLAKDSSKTVAYYVRPARIVDWYVATKGIRLFSTFGRWYNKHTIERLDPLFQKPEPPPCPNCGATHTFFYVRDGPYAIGHDLWNESFAFQFASIPTERPRAATDAAALAGRAQPITSPNRPDIQEFTRYEEQEHAVYAE